MLALLLVAASVGLSNFAAAIGIGAAGVDASTRLRVGLVFGAFESGMPVIGLLIGDRLAGQMGHAARWLGAALLMGVGVYGLVRSLMQRGDGDRDGAGQLRAGGPPHPGRLLLTGLALSLDNLVVGFALGTYQTSILAGAAVIGAVSVALSLTGLELGARIGAWAPQRGEQIGGVILISVGIAIASGALA
jgi:putative Mn2+ efflux pump MntP